MSTQLAKQPGRHLRGPSRARLLREAIGNTPLLSLPLSHLPPNVAVHAKAEWLNPGGSVKDRAALAIVSAAERAGELPGKRLLDASSGNTAIAYAMLGAAHGFGVTICLPETASAERRALLTAYGAEIVPSDPLEGSDGAIRQARAIAAREPASYFYADQYNNPANLRAHLETTGPEIWRQTGGRITHLIAGLGTTGTLMGAGRFLRSRNPAVSIVAVEPDDGFHGIEGLKHIPSSIIPGLYDASLLDRTLRVRTEEAYGWTRRLAREAGLFVGPSSGAAAAAADRLAAELTDGVVVVVFPDGGERYLSLDLWGDSHG